MTGVISALIRLYPRAWRQLYDERHQQNDEDGKSGRPADDTPGVPDVLSQRLHDVPPHREAFAND
jgi:hypothetical protein